MPHDLEEDPTSGQEPFSNEVGRLIRADSTLVALSTVCETRRTRRGRTRTRASGGSVRLCSMKHLASEFLEGGGIDC